MDIHVTFHKNQLKIASSSVQKLVAEFVSFAQVSYDEVSVNFVDTGTLCAMHAEYFDDPSVTDCISFPIDDPEEEGYRMMGDVFVCPETAIDYVGKHGGDVYQEVTLYVIHGLLHLIGYDDIEDEDRQEMREAEAVHLENIRKKALWLKSECDTLI